MEATTRALSDRWYKLYGAATLTLLGWLTKRAAGFSHCKAPVEGRLLYVAASALPYHTSGYTTRTHAVLKALIKAGVDVFPLTRPGYPWDRSDARGSPSQDKTAVDGIGYWHNRSPSNFRPLSLYVYQAALTMMRAAERHQACLIHAASNHVNALPALYAAKCLGVPFYYEMRGIWELTRASRFPGFEETEKCRLGLMLEKFVALHADRVFVISGRLGEYIQKHWGVQEEKIFLLPNCVDPQDVVPADPLQVCPNTIGYAGSLISYEGLDTLIDAISLLRNAGVNIKVNIVGDGEVRKQLESQVQRLDLEDRIRFYGKVSPASAREILGRCALVCLPRKPFKVCEIVAPIKLVEALAMAKPVIVSDLPVFRDEMGESPAGWFFKAGDAGDLASVIQSAFESTPVLTQVGAQARSYVLSRRRWQDFILNMVPKDIRRG